MMVATGMAFALVFLSPPQDPAVKAAIRKFQAEFYRAGATPDDKIGAAQALAAHPDEAVLRVLSPALYREAATVRIAVVREMTGFGGVPGTGTALLSALRNRANGGTKHAAVRIMLLRGVGQLKCVDAAADVNRLVEDPSIWIAKAAIDAAGRLGQRSSVPPLIGALKRIEGPAGTGLPNLGILDELKELLPEDEIVKRATSEALTERDVLRQPLLDALQAITGKSLPSGRDYEAWWKSGGRSE